MKVNTPSGLAKTAAARWFAQYMHSMDQPNSKGRTPRGVWDALVALGSEPRPEDVDRIIGNDSWTRCRCYLCKADAPAVVVISAWDDKTSELCAKCVKRADQMLANVGPA